MKRRMLLLVGALVLVLASQAPSRAQAPASETELLQRLSSQPADITNYLELVKLYTAARRFDDAEQMLVKAMTVLRQIRTAPIPPVAPGVPRASVGSDRTLLPSQAPIRVGGDVPEPKKVKDVRPVYPAEAQAAKVQGIVILEIVVGTNGSVVRTRVLRSVPLLDQAAIDAASQWEFTPTLLNNMPVEVVMTVTVNFTLS
jgi:TonB family protein